MKDKKNQINPINLKFAPKQPMTKPPRGLYADVARVLGARCDYDGTMHVIREELSQDEIMQRYQAEIAIRHNIQPPERFTPRHEFLTEGFKEVLAVYDRDYDDY